MDVQEAIVAAEQKYEEIMHRIVRVSEDELQDLNLGTEGDPKVVKISVHVDGKFKDDLKELLMEFRDVFAWEYSDFI